MRTPYAECDAIISLEHDTDLDMHAALGQPASTVLSSR